MTSEPSTDTPRPKRSDGLLTVDLGPNVKADWVRWCSERGLTAGRGVRDLVERALADGLEFAATPAGERVVLKAAPRPDEGPKVGREIYFTQSEDAAIERAAELAALGYHQWVIAAVRAALAAAPAYGQAELEALTASNLQLARLVRDLADWKRRESEASVSERIAHLEATVRMHVETVSAAMAQGTRRWQLKE